MLDFEKINKTTKSLIFIDTEFQPFEATSRREAKQALLQNGFYYNHLLTANLGEEWHGVRAYTTDKSDIICYEGSVEQWKLVLEEEYFIVEDGSEVKIVC